MSEHEKSPSLALPLAFLLAFGSLGVAGYSFLHVQSLRTENDRLAKKVEAVALSDVADADAAGENLVQRVNRHDETLKKRAQEHEDLALWQALVDTRLKEVGTAGAAPTVAAGGGAPPADGAAGDAGPGGGMQNFLKQIQQGLQQGFGEFGRNARLLQRAQQDITPGMSEAEVKEIIDAKKGRRELFKNSPIEDPQVRSARGFTNAFARQEGVALNEQQQQRLSQVLTDQLQMMDDKRIEYHERGLPLDDAAEAHIREEARMESERRMLEFMDGPTLDQFKNWRDAQR